MTRKAKAPDTKTVRTLLDRHTCPVPFHAVRTSRFTEVRLLEIDGFLDGLFGEEAEIELPERAHLAVGMLQKMRGMMAGVVDLADRDVVAHELSDDEQGQIAATFEQLREMTRIMEAEVHEAILSCARARRQGLTGIPTASPVLH